MSKSKAPKPNIKKVLESGAEPKHRFIENYKELKTLVEACKEMGYRIVLTQGVFDLIHEGHAAYLSKAKSHGDLLIVGVDSDALTKQRKGPNRPIVPEDERIKMLLHIRSVDIVTIRDIKDGLGGLIKLVQPDVLIASQSTADFKKDMVYDYNKYCGKIVILPPQATTSTTGRIRKLSIEGAEKLAREVSKLTQDFLNNIKNG